MRIQNNYIQILLRLEFMN